MEHTWHEKNLSPTGSSGVVVSSNSSDHPSIISLYRYSFLILHCVLDYSWPTNALVINSTYSVGPASDKPSSSNIVISTTKQTTNGELDTVAFDKTVNIPFKTVCMFVRTKLIYLESLAVCFALCRQVSLLSSLGIVLAIGKVEVSVTWTSRWCHPLVSPAT